MALAYACCMALHGLVLCLGCAVALSFGPCPVPRSYSLYHRRYVMTMQSRLNSSSLPVLAICAAKALQQIYPYMKPNISEENGEYVITANNGEKLLRLYRQDNEDGSYNHNWDEYESDTFIVEDWNFGEAHEYKVYTLVYEFEEVFFTEVILNQELPIERFPNEMVKDMVSIIFDHHDRVSIRFEQTGLAGDIRICDEYNNDLGEPWYCYKPKKLIALLEEVAMLHNTYYE